MLKFVEVENIKELAELTSEIWHEFWCGVLSPQQIDYMVDKFQSERAMTEQIKNENYIYFYIVSDKEKAGYIGLSHKDNHLFLSKIYIKKDYRHKGAGTKAFEFIKDYAKSCNYNNIILTVKKTNENAIKAYEKWGFKTIDAVVTDIGNGFVMDDYIMQYSL